MSREAHHGASQSQHQDVLLMTIHQRPQHDFGIGQQLRKSWKKKTQNICLDQNEIRMKSQDGHHPSLLTFIFPK
jgi:hypothetical protein